MMASEGHRFYWTCTCGCGTRFTLSIRDDEIFPQNMNFAAYAFERVQRENADLAMLYS